MLQFTVPNVCFSEKVSGLIFRQILAVVPLLHVAASLFQMQSVRLLHCMLLM